MAHEERPVVTLGPQGRIVIPAGVRRRLGLERGDAFALSVEHDQLVLRPQAVAAKHARGLYKHLATDTSVVDELIGERREAARREQTG